MRDFFQMNDKTLINRSFAYVLHKIYNIKNIRKIMEE